MKSIILSLGLFLAFSLTVQAQIETPASSPFCKLEQKVGLTDVTLEYSRPSMKEREVFGHLVPYGKPWRTGANAATKLTVSTGVTIEGEVLEPGSYALLTVPGESEWELHFFPYSSRSWGSYLADDAPEATIVKVGSQQLPFNVETLFFDIGDLRNGSATINLVWESTVVSARMEVPTDAAVEEMIASTMSGPSASDYRAAATYYYQEGKDMEKALEWIDMSLEKGGERFWILRQKALIQASLEDYAGAIETAERSTALAEEAGNEDYPRMNAESIAEWNKM